VCNLWEPLLREWDDWFTVCVASPALRPVVVNVFGLFFCRIFTPLCLCLLGSGPATSYLLILTLNWVFWQRNGGISYFLHGLAIFSIEHSRTR
jgi:hypothetical protein